MKKILVFGFLLILLIGSVQASIIGTIGMQGLSMASQEAATALNTIVCVSELVTCAGKILTSKVSGELMRALAEVSPEAAQAVATYNQIKGYLDTGSEIIEDLKINDKGQIEEGRIQFGNEEESKIGNLIGENLTDDDVSVKGVELIKTKDESVLVFKEEDSKLCVKGDCFANIQKQDRDTKTEAYIELDDKGEIKEADITSNEKGSSFKFDQKTVKVPGDTRVTYKDGKIRVHGQKNFDLFHSVEGKVLGHNKIQIFKGEGVTIHGNEIIGDHFRVLTKYYRELGEVYSGKVKLVDNRITELGKYTLAKVRGIEHKTFKGNLNLYYDPNFEMLDHVNENYFNYGIDKISLGGHGFTSKLKEGNDIFPEFKEEIYVQGTSIPPQKGAFEVSPYGGFLEVERDTTKEDLAFKIKYEGYFKIKNGGEIIFSPPEAEELYYEQNTEYDFSYDVNFNNEYTSEDSILTNKNKYLIVNHNPLWGDTLRKVRKINLDLREEIKRDIQDEWNIRPRNFFGYINDEREKDLVRWVYEGADTASKNKYDVVVYPSELYTTMILEGGNNFLDRYYYLNHYSTIDGFTYLGTDDLGPYELERLKEDNFIPSDFEFLETRISVNENVAFIRTPVFIDLEDGLVGLAGMLAERKHVFLQDFKDHFGEKELKKLTKDEEYFWTYLYFNCGYDCGKGQLTGTNYETGRGEIVRGKGRNRVYKPLEYPEGNIMYARENSLIRMATKKWIDSLNVFDYP